MKAIVINNYGDSSVLKYEEVPVPEIKKNQVLVKVFAASVNHFDIKVTAGMMKDWLSLSFPWTPGYDFAGIIESVGSEVTGLKKGDKVYGNSNGGSYAEYAAVKSSTVVLKPEILSFTEAASVPLVGETAWQAIHTHAELKSGQRILIHGAAGAVGAYAVQFAKAVNAVVYANSEGKDKDYLKSLSADVVIDYQTQDFTTIAKDIDVVIDLIGGETQKRSYQVLKRGGRLVSTIGISTQEEADKYGVKAIGMSMERSGEDLKKISGLISAGKLKWNVEMVLPLKDAKKGWDILLRKDPSLPKISHGKIVLEVNA